MTREQVLSLNEAELVILEELELKNDGLSNGTQVLESNQAKFQSKGIKSGDKVIILNTGYYSVISDPSSETQLELDRTVPISQNLVFSIGREIRSKKRSTLAQNYPGSGDLELTDAAYFKGYIESTYYAEINNLQFSYTHKLLNTLRGVSGLSAQPKGSLILQERDSAEIFFIQNLKIAPRANRALIQQYRTKYRKNFIINEYYQVDFSAFLTDLDLDKRLKNQYKSFSLRIIYKNPENFTKDGFNILGCHISGESLNNQDNSESTTELSYQGTYRDILCRDTYIKD